MATIRECLKKLPLQKRLQAMENIRLEEPKGDFNWRLNIEPYANQGLLCAFTWSESKQGHDYWSNINKKYFK